MYEYQTTLLRIVDGDTIDVSVDLGMHIYHHTALRLYGVNTPEMRTAEGKAARTWVLDWFAAHAPAGTFLVRTVRDKTEKYGRWLATVIAPDGHVLNDDLLAAGQAVVYLP